MAFLLACALGFHEYVYVLTVERPACNWLTALTWFVVLGSYYFLPLVIAYQIWARARTLCEGRFLAQLVLTSVPRRSLLRASLYRPRLWREAAYMVLVPLFLTHWSVPFLPVYPLTLIFPARWSTAVMDGEILDWWFTSFDETDGRVVAAMVALVGLHCSLRFAFAVSAWCAVTGRDPKRSLVLALLWTLAPLAAGLALAHLVQVYLILPNWNEPISNWFGRWVTSKEVPFYYALAAMSAVALLPVAVAALFSGRLLRSAARRLDRLVTD